MQGRKLRIDRVVGAVVVVGLIAGGCWWAITESGEEEESPRPVPQEVVLPEPEPSLAKIEAELSRVESKLGKEVSSLKETMKRLPSTPVEPVTPTPPEAQVQEESSTAALGRMLHDFADFVTLTLPKIGETIEDMTSAISKVLPTEEAAPPPPPEEKGLLAQLCGSMLGKEASPQDGGGLISQICGTLTESCTQIVMP
jgi:hypothetical protein